MYHVYLLRSKISYRKFYIGFTSRKINERIKDHNYGAVGATKLYRPWSLIYLETYVSESDARKREKMLKQYGSSLGQLKKRLFDTLNKD